MNKICCKCKKQKDIEEFSFNNKEKLIRHSKCKSCVIEYNKTYKSKNIETIRDKWRKASRKYTSVDKRRNKTLKQYGLTIDTYNKMFDEQEGKCKICESNLTLCVDHCHRTGKIRGLLCNKCNVGIGCFRDDIDLLQKVILYLE